MATPSASAWTFGIRATRRRRPNISEPYVGQGHHFLITQSSAGRLGLPDWIRDLHIKLNGGRLIADATNLDLIPSASFQNVAANHLPGEIGVAQGILRESLRVLKPGGTGTFSSSSLGNMQLLMEQAGFANIRSLGRAPQTIYGGRVTGPALLYTGTRPLR
jgi:hypothetical protein